MGLKNFLSKTRVIDIQSCLPDGIVLITTEGTIQWNNDVAMTLFPQVVSLINTNIDEYLVDGLNIIIASANTAKPVVAKTVGSEEYMELTAKAIEGAYVVSLRDATQKYKTVNTIIEGHENSKKINNDKNTFLIKLSNDLKSPLHSIVGFSQAIIDGLGGKVSEKQEKYLKIINKNSSDLLYFFNKLLELSQTESDAFEKDIKFFDIANTINSVIRTSEQLYSEKKLEMSLTVEENVKKTIYSDEKAFKLMFQTLMETLIRATDLGTIEVNLATADEEFLTTHNLTDCSGIVVTIMSSSNGILESEIPTLFDPYAVVDKSNKRSILRAIALASVRNLMNYLHGIVWAETVPLKGTAFKIILPFEKEVNE